MQGNRNGRAGAVVLPGEELEAFVTLCDGISDIAEAAKPSGEWLGG